MAISHPICNIQLLNNNLNNLKCDLASKINSIRIFERIESIRDLVDILWKRDEIKKQNIDEWFADSFCVFNRNEREIIKDYVSELDAKYSDYPVVERKEAETQLPVPTKFKPPMDPEKPPNLSPRSEQFHRHKDDIFRLIAQDLGQRKFLDFARQTDMKIIEGELENIAERYRDVPSRIHHVLKIASERITPEEFPDVILNSLKYAGRIDLKKRIEQNYLS